MQLGMRPGERKCSWSRAASLEFKSVTHVLILHVLTLHLRLSTLRPAFALQLRLGRRAQGKLLTFRLTTLNYFLSKALER